MSEQDIQARLAEIRQSYITSLTSRRDNIIELWAALQAQWHTTECKTLHRLVHSLAGSAETFGFADITQCARTLVDDFRQLDDAEPDPTTCARLETRIRMLTELLARHAGEQA